MFPSTSQENSNFTEVSEGPSTRRSCATKIKSLVTLEENNFAESSGNGNYFRVAGLKAVAAGFAGGAERGGTQEAPYCLAHREKAGFNAADIVEREGGQ